MSQIKVTGATVYQTIMLGGQILNPRYYGEGELLPTIFRKMLEYEGRQKALPPDKRDRPPALKVDYIDVDEIRNQQAQTKTNVEPKKQYSELGFADLKRLVKERGLTFDSKAKLPDLIAMLEADDVKIRKELSWQEQFKSLDDFMPLSDEDKMAYIDDIFGLPEGMDNESEEAEKYSTDLISAIRVYSSQSVSEQVAAKLKEVLEYYES